MQAGEGAGAEPAGGPRADRRGPRADRGGGGPSASQGSPVAQSQPGKEVRVAANQAETGRTVLQAGLEWG